MRNRPHLYIAAPLFSDEEKNLNEELRELLQPYFHIYLPQKDGGLLTELVKDGRSVKRAKRLVYERDIRAIRRARVILIVLNGRTVDEGASFELGFGKAIRRSCYGYQTDTRRLLPVGNNPMIEVPLRCIFHSKRELQQWAKRYAARYARG